MKCRVCFVGSVKCGVCFVGSAKCGVRSVKCRVWSFKWRV